MRTQTSNLSVVYYFVKKWRQEWRLALGVVGPMPINVALNQIIPPLIIAAVLNRLASHDYTSGDVWGSFGPALVLYTVTVLAGSLMWRITDYFGWRLEANIQKHIGAEVFNHLVGQSARFHADNFSGSLVSKTNKLLGAYVRFADTTWFGILPLFFGLLFSLIVLARVAPLYGLVLLVFAVLYMITAVFVTRKTRRLGAQHASVESEQTGVLADAVTNAMAIKSFARKRYEVRLFNRALTNTRRSLLDVSRAHQKQQLYFGTLLSGISAAALVGAVIAVLIFDANVATVFVIFSYTANIAEQLFSFSNNSLRAYNRSIGDASDMVSMLATPSEIQDPVEPIKATIRRGDITFKDVLFQHEGANDALFNTLNLHIKPGEKVGLVGRSGSGKTTLTRILLRFSDIQAGQILLDGQNIAAMRQDDLRSAITYVPQEPLLFHRSIEENIAYGDLYASKEAIAAAAKMAHADEFIQDLPKGYHTLVGERGVKLSGGQRQRVVIARAMLKNAPVLVLDEATSALDSESELLIQDALWKLMQDKTAIVIAHRLSTIQKMDRIIVMDEGKILEQGSHKELLSRGGTYAKLWAHQSGGFIDEA